MVNYLKGMADAFAAIHDEDQLDSLLATIRKDWDLPELEHPEKVKPVLRSVEPGHRDLIRTLHASRW